GSYVLLQYDVPRQMEFIAARLAGASGTIRPLQREPVELSSRVPSRELPAKLNSLAVPLVTDDDPYAERETSTTTEIMLEASTLSSGSS
ncbi:hypothetical protein ACC724_38470, partial [Rhizobium ruizarguesonis]